MYPDSIVPIHSLPSLALKRPLPEEDDDEISFLGVKKPEPFFILRLTFYTIQGIQAKMRPEAQSKLIRTCRFLKNVCCAATTWPLIYIHKLFIVSDYRIMILPYCDKYTASVKRMNLDHEGYNIANYAKSDDLLDKRNMRRLRIKNVAVDCYKLCNLESACKNFLPVMKPPAKFIDTQEDSETFLFLVSADAKALKYLNSKFQPQIVKIDRFYGADTTAFLDCSNLIITTMYTNEKGIDWNFLLSKLLDTKMNCLKLALLDDGGPSDKILDKNGFRLLWSRDDHRNSIIGDVDVQEINGRSHNLYFQYTHPVSNCHAFVKINAGNWNFSFQEVPTEFDFSESIKNDLKRF